jgi:hypothetical protein
MTVSRPRRVPTAGVGAAVAALLFTSCGAGTESSTVDLPDTPTKVALAHEIDDAADPTELMELPDVVVIGTVTAVGSGRDRGDSSTEKMTDRLVTLTVSDVLKGESQQRVAKASSSMTSTGR